MYVNVNAHSVCFQQFKCGGELTLSLLVSEDCARALHVCLEELRRCNQTGLLCWRQT